MRQRLIQSIRYIPPLPAILIKILDLLNDDRSNALNLEEIISRDQALSAKILAVANSAYYGFRTKTLSIRRAVVALGYEEIRNICLGASLMGFLHPSTFQDQKAAEDLWLHSLTTSETAKIVSQVSPATKPDTAFTAGLLHDLGKAVLMAFFPEEANELTALMKGERGLSYRQAEKILGVDHCQLGVDLARQWELPPPLVECMERHHNLKNDLPFLDLTATIHIADFLARVSGLGNSGNPDDPVYDQLAATALKLNPARMVQCQRMVMERKERIKAIWAVLLAK